MSLAISFGAHHATVVPLGGALASYTVGERCLVEATDGDRTTRDSRGAPLLPWPNRIADGRYDFGGHSFQLPITEVGRGNAIHGLTLGATWRIETRTGSSIVFATTIEPQPGYPFRLSASVEYALGDGGLTITTTARNAGHGPLPYGAGHHPYLHPVSASVDAAVLHLAASTWYPSDDRGLPLAERSVVGTDRDFRVPGAIGDVELDTCYTGFQRDAAGRMRVTLDETVLWMDGAYGWVMVYTGDSLADQAQRRRSLAVEPMTCPPNAFRTGAGLIVLDPGQRHVARWGIEPGR